jgi:hypothetical protein
MTTRIINAEQLLSALEEIGEIGRQRDALLAAAKTAHSLIHLNCRNRSCEDTIWDVAATLTAAIAAAEKGTP